MTNSARLSGRPSSSAAYNVGDVVDTPDSAIKSWRYLGAGEWEPNDAVRYTMGPGGGIGIPVGSTGLMLPATLRQQPNQSWPAARPAYDGPITLIGWSDPPAWPGGEYDQYIDIPRIYVPVIDDFSTAQVGPIADQWLSRWSRQHAPAEIVADSRARNGMMLRIVSNAAATNLSLWTRSLFESNQSMLARIVAPATNTPTATYVNGVTLVVRASDPGLDTGSSVRFGYALSIRGTATREIRLHKWVAGANTQLGSSVQIPGDDIKSDNAVIWMELTAVGTTIEGRVWLDGQDRSTAYLLTATDSDVATGYAAFHSNPANYVINCDYLSLAYDGNPAPGPGV